MVCTRYETSFNNDRVEILIDNKDLGFTNNDAQYFSLVFNVGN